MEHLLDPGNKLFTLAFVFITGLCIGSFLNVMALRFLADEPISHPPSHCPHCQAAIRPGDNIPVISYLLLGGQCRDCKTPISIQYPLVEIGTGLLFMGTVWQFGLGWETLFFLFLMMNLVVIFITDLRESLIFQINSLSLVPAGLLYNALPLQHLMPGTTPLDLGRIVWHMPNALTDAVLGVIVAIVFFEGMILLSQWVFGTEGFGHGDTHLMMGAGAFLGWKLTLLALILGFVCQTIPAVPMLVYQWIKNKQWISLISGAVALLGGTTPLFLMNLPMDIGLRTAISLGCMVLSIGALIVFLKQVKNSQSFTYLPLGPALVIGILIALFWGPQLLMGYQSLLKAP